MMTQIKYPSRVKGLMAAVLFSWLAQAAILMAIRVAPIVGILMGVRGIDWVEEPYDPTKINKIRWLTYPPGYLGFRPPQKIRSLDDIKKEEERLQRLKERKKREAELAKKREDEERAKAEEKAKAELAKAEPPP